MKKYFILFIGLIAIFLFTTNNLHAYDEGLVLSFNSGVYTDDSFKFKPFYWTAGLNMDIHFANFLMLSPECYFIVHNFKFRQSWIAPAALLNLKFNTFFIGAGFTKQFYLGEGGGSTDFLLKMNSGFREHGWRLVAFLITGFNEYFDYNEVGLTLGFEF